MKTLYLFISILFMSFLLQGQSVLHYDLSSSLNEVNGNGPTLEVLGNDGVYIQDTLNEIGSATRSVYRFETNSGLQFDNTLANNFLGENYTIELYFVFDQLNSWKRVVDWKNRTSDYGAYVYNGKLNFYPYETSANAPVVAGEYTYYVVTRNSENNELLIYTDAVNYITLTDLADDGLLNQDNVLNLFHDDLVVPNEASSGAVAMIKLYNYTLDSTAIQNHFDDLAGNVFFIGENKKLSTSINTFPNPVNEKLNVDISNFSLAEKLSVKLISIVGTTVYETKLQAGNSNSIVINTSELNNGIYVIMVESDAKQAIGKILIQR